MGHTAVWKVLDEMVADFRKKGLDIPQTIVSDLKNAKTLLNALEAETDRVENIQEIDQCLVRVETFLVSEGQQKIGVKHVDEWLERLDKAGKEIFDQREEENRFIPGVPRHKKWIRVTSSKDLPLKKLKAAADKMKLKHEEQKGSSLLIYGEGQTLKDFVKRMALKNQSKAMKYRKKVHNR